MNKYDIELPPLPPTSFFALRPYETEYTPNYSAGEMMRYARDAIKPYQQRIEELESQLEAIGAGGVTQGQRLVESDRKTCNPIGEGTIQQLHDVLLYLQNETMKLEAAYGSNFKKEATEKARAATERMNEAVYAIKNIDRKRRGESHVERARRIADSWPEWKRNYALTKYDVKPTQPAEPPPELMRLMPEVLASLKSSGLDVSLAADVERALAAVPAQEPSAEEAQPRQEPAVTPEEEEAWRALERTINEGDTPD